jgi:hypothetical protein
VLPHLPLQARLLQFRKWVVCIISMNVALRELLWRPNMRTRFGVGGRAFLSLGCNGAKNPCMVPRPVGAINVLFDLLCATAP